MSHTRGWSTARVAIRVCPRARIGYSSERTPSWIRRRADVAQLVEHHLAKVRVAGSNPVVRSEAPDVVARARRLRPGHRWALSGSAPAAEWPSGLGKGLQSPVRGFDSRLRLGSRAISSVGERYLDTVEATGSIPVSPTRFVQVVGQFPGPGAGILDRLSPICHQDLTGYGDISRSSAAHPSSSRPARRRLAGFRHVFGCGAR